jgi:dynein heavy chain, axonemal
VQEKSEDVRIVSIEIQRELDECVPAIEASCKALELIERNELKDVKSTNKPPSLLRLLMEPVCILLDCK